MLIQEIKKKLASYGDSVSVPELRKLARQIAKENALDFLNANPQDSFYLRMLHAFVIGYAKNDIQVLIPYFEDFIPYVNHWGICDSLCQNFRIARQYPQETWQMLMKYKNSQKEFESRIVSVTLLSHYMTEAYIGQVFPVLDSLYSGDYYAQMGIAWALATAMAKFPDKCIAYLQSGNNHLDHVTYRRTLQKIRESNRVPAEIKQMTKTK